MTEPVSGEVETMADKRAPVTSQDFIKFWSEIFAFVLLMLIEISQGFKLF
jgi:hypothetical protein